MIRRLREYGVDPVVTDPWASQRDAMREYGVTLTPLSEIKDADCIIVAVAHQEFREMGLAGLRKLFRNTEDQKVLIDVKGLYPVAELKAADIKWWRL